MVPDHVLLSMYCKRSLDGIRMADTDTDTDLCAVNKPSLARQLPSYKYISTSFA